MKNKFYKKVFWGIILIVLFGLISTGCLGTGGGGGGPIILPPTTCTIIVMDQTGWMWGNVYMDGMPVPNGLLTSWGSVQINNVTIGVQHVIYIVDLSGWVSHSEFIVPTVGTNYINFLWF